MSPPRVSVVVCTYNNAATLGRSLESLAAQDYENFHIVVVDDCSSDDSVAVAKEYEARFPEIVRSVKNKKNLGLVGNYSSANRFFEGAYFMLGGPDDSWMPNFLSSMVALLEENPKATIAMSSVLSRFDDGESNVYSYDTLSNREARGGASMACAVINGVDASGEWSVPFNSFIHGVGRSLTFSAALPNDRVFWYIELQIIAMFALLGGLVTWEEPLYVRHRFRQSWEERSRCFAPHWRPP
jgi:glycosyltransferase involved in cell wall biosynthesis